MYSSLEYPLSARAFLGLKLRAKFLNRLFEENSAQLSMIQTTFIIFFLGMGSVPRTVGMELAKRSGSHINDSWSRGREKMKRGTVAFLDHVEYR